MTAGDGGELIHHLHGQSNYTLIDNAVLRDKRLTPTGTGVLVRLASNVPGWRFNAELLAKEWNGLTRNGAEVAIRDLSRHGYIHRVIVRNGNRLATQLHLFIPASSDCRIPGCQSCDPAKVAAHSDQAERDPVTPNISGVTEPPGLIEDHQLPEDHTNLGSLRSPSSSDPASQADADKDDSTGLDAPGARADVERVCEHLADRLEQRFGDRPVIGKRWRTAARLMLDGTPTVTAIPEENIHRAIDWCQDNEFWQPNIQSLPKLREKYKQLRAQAQREQQRNGGIKLSTTDARVNDNLGTVERFRAKEAAALNGASVPQITS